MVISSRTPEGRPNRCPVCGSEVAIEPSDPAADAPCPRCGHLLWFTREDLGDALVIRPTEDRLDAEAIGRLIDTTAMRPVTRLVIDCGGIQYLASSDLGKLINLKKRLSPGGARLILRNVHPDLADVFRITRLDQVFQVEP
ncbi:MAG: STAS domain-containing protein [Isosphaeraceae bacterium]